MESIKFRTFTKNSENVEVSLVIGCPWNEISNTVGTRLGFPTGIDYVVLIDDDGDEFGGAITDADKFWRYFSKRYSGRVGMAFVAQPKVIHVENSVSKDVTAPTQKSNQHSSKDVALSRESPKYSENGVENDPDNSVPVRFKRIGSTETCTINVPLSCEWDALTKSLINKLKLGSCQIEKIVLTDGDNDEIGQAITNKSSFWKTYIKKYNDTESTTFVIHTQDYESFRARLSSNLNKKLDILMPVNATWDDMQIIFQKEFQIKDTIRKLVVVDQQGNLSNPVLTMSAFWKLCRSMKNVKEVFAVLENDIVGSVLSPTQSNTASQTRQSALGTSIGSHSGSSSRNASESQGQSSSGGGIGLEKPPLSSNNASSDLSTMPSSSAASSKRPGSASSKESITSEAANDGFGRRLQSRQLIPTVEPSLTEDGHSVFRVCLSTDKPKKVVISVPSQCGWEQIVGAIVSGLSVPDSMSIRHVMLTSSDGSHLSSNIQSAPEFWKNFQRNYKHYNNMEFVAHLQPSTVSNGIAAAASGSGNGTGVRPDQSEYPPRSKTVPTPSEMRSAALSRLDRITGDDSTVSSSRNSPTLAPTPPPIPPSTTPDPIFATAVSSEQVQNSPSRNERSVSADSSNEEVSASPSSFARQRSSDPPSRLARRTDNSNKISTQLFMEVSKLKDVKEDIAMTNPVQVIPSIDSIRASVANLPASISAATPTASISSFAVDHASSNPSHVRDGNGNILPPIPSTNNVQGSIDHSANTIRVIFARFDTPNEKKDVFIVRESSWEILCDQIIRDLQLTEGHTTITHFALYDFDGDMLSPALNKASKFWKFCSKYKVEIGMTFRVFFEVQKDSSKLNLSSPNSESRLSASSGLDKPQNMKAPSTPPRAASSSIDASASQVDAKISLSALTISSPSSQQKQPGSPQTPETPGGVEKSLVFRGGDPVQLVSITITKDFTWDRLLEAVATSLPPWRPSWIQNFVLTDGEGESLSLALENFSKFWKLANKFRKSSGSYFQVHIDQRAFEDWKASQAKPMAIIAKPMKTKIIPPLDTVIKVRLFSDKKRIAFISINSKATWDSLREETAMAFGLITANRIRHFVLIDSDGEEISTELSNADKMKSICQKVYSDEAGMFFDVHILDLPQKSNEPQAPQQVFNSAPQPTPLQAFHLACVNGDISACRRLVLSGVDFMGKDENGMYAIHLASLAGHIDIVKWLLSLNVSVDVPDQNEMTPLHCACDGMHSALVLILVEAGGNLLSKNTYGLTPIHYIALRGLIELAHLLKAHTINLASSSGLTCLHCASDGGHEEMTEYLLTHGAHVDARDYEGLTPLHYACLSGNWTAAQILVEYGAFWNVRDDEGMSPLLYACHEGHLEIVQWLAAIGGSIFARNDLGHTALHLACASGSIELVNWLLMKGLDLDCRSKSGLTPFHFASDAGNVELAEFLSAAGGGLWMENEAEALARCKVDEDNETFLRACEAEEERVHSENFSIDSGEDDSEEESGDGVTTVSAEGPLDSQLRDACAKGHSDLVFRLLKGGANPNAKNSNGSTAMHFASAIGNMGVAKKLVEFGGNVNVANMKSSTPLHFTCDRNHIDLTIWLAENGGDLYAKNAEGYTPLHYLSTRGKSDAILSIAKTREDFDPNCCGSKDISLLHCAAEQGHPETIHVLIKLGALVDSVDDENETPLHYACLRGHLLAAKALVSHKAVLNVRDNEGSTPLFYACASGSVELAKWLVSQGALLHNINRRGNTCLHVACKVGNTDMAMWLVDAGIDVDFKNVNGHTPMDFAIAGSHTELVKALERKIEEAKEVAVAQAETIAAFHRAATVGNLNVVNQILRDGMDANVRNANQSTALHFACMSGQSDVVQRLYASKADLNAINHTGLSPFLCVCIYGDLELAKWLLEHGADASHKTADGRTALHHASLNGHLPIVKWLINIGFDPMCTSMYGLTPVTDACYGGHLEILKYLAREGAAITMRASETAPIHIASEQGHLEVVVWLMEAGAPADVSDTTGKTPFLYACLQGHLDVAQALARNGVNIRATGGASDRLNTALHLACQNGHMDVVKWLVECGLDINAENEHKHTPIDFAAAGEHKDVVKWLTERGAQYFHETIRTKKQPRLEEALDANDFQLARTLLEDLVMSIDPTSLCEGGQSPLHFAAACGHLDLAQHLIICGADVNALTHRGMTPLHYAAMKGQTEIVQYLAGLGAKLNVIDRHGSTPMNVASQFKQIESFQWLRDNGGLTGEQIKEASGEMKFDRSMFSSPFACLAAPLQHLTDSSSCANTKGGIMSSMDNSFRGISSSVSRTALIPSQNSFDSLRKNADDDVFSAPLHDACAAGDLAQVKLLVESGAGINAQNPSGASTSLHMACVSGDLTVVQYLAERGAKLDLQNVGGMTPLHVACDRRFTDVALYLIRKGASILERNKIGDTPLHKMCARGMVELLESVIELPRAILPNLDLEFKTDRGATPLHAAVDQGCLSIVKLLIAQGVQLNPRDEENKTPLHYACIKGHQNIAVFLKDNGAFINARDNQGFTPFLLALSSEHLQLAKWLVAHGANIKGINDAGDTGLHIACKVGNIDMVRWLLESRLDPKLQNNLHITPEQYAEDRGYSEVVSLIDEFLKNPDNAAIHHHK